MVGNTIGVSDGPIFGIDHRLDGRVQHRVDEFSVRARTERPADDHAVEAVDQAEDNVGDVSHADPKPTLRLCRLENRLLACDAAQEFQRLPDWLHGPVD